jgi:hypothetical protein
MNLSEAVKFVRAVEAAGFDAETFAEAIPPAASSWKFEVLNGAPFAITPDGARRPLREHVEKEWPSLAPLLDADGRSASPTATHGERRPPRRPGEPLRHVGLTRLERSIRSQISARVANLESQIELQESYGSETSHLKAELAEKLEELDQIGTDDYREKVERYAAEIGRF